MNVLHLGSVQVNEDDVVDEDVGDDDDDGEGYGNYDGDSDVDCDDDDWDGVQAGGGCSTSTSGKCPMQAPGSLTTPDLHPVSIANEQKKKRKS